MKELEPYLERANEIIGERTKEEELYDSEVVKWLKKYGKIRKALNRANIKYPDEALKYDDSNIGDLEARYEYMVEHYEIVKRMGH
jgi:DNA-binding protein H-NS